MNDEEKKKSKQSFIFNLVLFFLTTAGLVSGIATIGSSFMALPIIMLCFYGTCAGACNLYTQYVKVLDNKPEEKEES